MRQRPDRYTTLSLALLLSLSCGLAAAYAADEKPARTPVDLDAEFWRKYRAWVEQAEPTIPAEFKNDKALADEFARGFREGAASWIRKPEAKRYDGYSEDPVERARASGRLDGFVEAAKYHFRFVAVIAKRIADDPDLRVKRATDVMRVVFEQRYLYDSKPRVKLTDYHPDLATALIERGADPNAPTQDLDKTRPLHLALKAERPALVKLILKRGAKPNATDARGWTPMHEVEDDESFAALLEHGADVTRADKTGRTPLLFHAFLVGFDPNALKRAAKMIEHGADATAADEDGRTPLHHAGNGKMVDLLVKHGARVDARTKTGDTPLHTAASASTVQALVRHGGDVHARNDAGDTPLNAMIHQDRYRGAGAIAALMAHGARLDAKNKQGRRPIDHPILSRVPQYVQRTGIAPTYPWIRTVTSFERRVPVPFDEIRLSNGIEYLSNIAGVNIYRDWEGMGVESDTRITLQSPGMPIKEALTAVLDQAAKGKLAWQVDHYGIVLISTPARLKGMQPNVPAKPNAKSGRTPKDTDAGQVVGQSAFNDPAPTAFESNRLQNVLTFISKAANRPVHADWPALEKLDVGRETPVTLYLSNVPARRVAELIVHQVAGERALARVRGGSLYISTPAGMADFIKKQSAESSD